MGTDDLKVIEAETVFDFAYPQLGAQRDVNPFTLEDEVSTRELGSLPTPPPPKLQVPLPPMLPLPVNGEGSMKRLTCTLLLCSALLAPVAAEEHSAAWRCKFKIWIASFYPMVIRFLAPLKRYAKTALWCLLCRLNRIHRVPWTQFKSYAYRRTASDILTQRVTFFCKISVTPRVH